MNALKNSVRLTGFLGADPEVKTFGKDKSLARVSIATHERYRNQQGEWTDGTQWHSLVFRGKRAVFASESLTKGSEVAIEGRLVNRQYTDKDGVARHVTEVAVNEIILFSRKPE